MKIRRIDHVGIVVEDLAAAKAFFLDLGFEMMGEQDVEGDWADRVVGLRGIRSSIVMLRAPEGGSNIELVKFHSPVDEQGVQPLPANAPGLRHFAMVVEDLDALVAKLKGKGTELCGEVVNYEDVYKVCCVKGPEGIILELAEELE